MDGYSARYTALRCRGKRVGWLVRFVKQVISLGKERVQLALKENDVLAVMGAGAYGFVMSSNYNSRGRAAEVMVMVKKRTFDS